MRFIRLFTRATAHAAVAAFLLTTHPAFGGQVTAAQLGANDTVGFGNFGVGAIITNQFLVTSSGGVNVHISEPSSNFAVLKQAPNGSWVGNFPDGTKIIYDQGPNGPVTFAFSTAIKGFGLTIDDAYGGGYTGTITEFNGASMIGSFSSSSPNPALMFLGVLDATADITSVTIDTTAVGNHSFAFGDLSLVDSVATSPATAPEPASIAFVLMGLAGLAASHLRLRRKRESPLKHPASA